MCYEVVFISVRIFVENQKVTLKELVFCVIDQSLVFFVSNRVQTTNLSMYSIWLMF